MMQLNKYYLHLFISLRNFYKGKSKVELWQMNCGNANMCEIKKTHILVFGTGL